MQNSSERLGCLDAAGLTLETSTSACPLILYCCKVWCGCVIVQGNDFVLSRSGKWLRERYRKHHPIEQTINQLRSTKRAIGNEQTTENYRPTKQPRSSNLSESGRIATKQATHLKAVGLWPTDQTIGQTRARVKAPPLRSELVKDLDQGLEVWNWPGAKRRPWRP